jgi:type IV pilus assembly protein PilA
MTPRDSHGFTLIELLIVVAIITIIAAFAIPNLLRSRTAANEASAIASLKAIGGAQQVYSATAAGGGFADALPTLGVPCGGTGQAFLGADLTSGPTAVKSGYTVGLTAASGAADGPVDCNGTATKTGYYATAVPVALGQTGSRGFASDASIAIWENTSGAAPSEAEMSSPPTQTVHPIR